MITDDYTAYRDDFMRMFVPSKLMWNGYLGHTTTATHRVKRDLAGTSPIQTVPYRAASKTIELWKYNIDSMLSINVTETAQSEWASPDVLGPKKE